MDKSNDPLGSEALRSFIDGIEKKMDPSFGSVSSREEERKVKRKIAQELGVEEEYHPNIFYALNGAGEDGTDAYKAVEERYDDLFEKGKLQEPPEYANGEGEGLFREVNRHIEGRKTEEE